MSGLPTDLCFNQFTLWALEPRRGGEQIEYIEQDRPRCTGPYQSGLAFTRSISDPYTYGIFGSYPHCPGIPETITGTRFPGNGLHGRNGTPVYLFGAVYFFDGVKCLPDCSGLEWRMLNDGRRSVGGEGVR